MNQNKPSEDWRIDHFRNKAKAMYSLLAAICAKHGPSVKFDLPTRQRVLRELDGQDCERGFDYYVDADKNTLHIRLK